MLKAHTVLVFLSGAALLACTGAVGDGSGSSPGGSKPGGSGNGSSGAGNNPGNSGNAGAGNGSGTGSGSSSSMPPNNTGALDDSMTVPGATPLRRLTRLEYDNTIRDLLGVSPNNGGKLTADQGSNDSGFNMGGSITGSTDARGVFSNAEEIATASLQKLDALLPCAPIPSDRSAQDDCANQFVEKFGLRAFRRPLSGSELDELHALYRTQRDAPVSGSFQQAIGALITAVLQTPDFLYHWELAPEGAIKEGSLIRLGPYELASRLSYLFWATMPDDALFTAAKEGHLASPDDIARESKRLLADDRAKAGVQDFFLQWLEIGNLDDLEKDPSITQFTPALTKAMNDETRNFVTSLFFGGQADGKLETLLTSSTSVIDAGLAKLYEVSGFNGQGPTSTQLDGSKRAGIFTQASFLTAKADAVDSHPVKRGDALLRRLLCTELVIPADLVVPPLPEPKPGQTTRERFSVHSSNPCATCHHMIDPVGFAFEHYDAIGGYRMMDAGKPVDATGTFTIGSGTLKFDGAVDLLKQLARTPEARDCMATQWLRYSLRRREIPTEAPSLKVLQTALGASGDLRDLMVAATKARTLTHRAPSPGEVTP